MMEEISAADLKQALENGEDLFLLDVREEEEHEAFHIGGMLVPLDELATSMSKLPRHKTLVVYCKRGIRSAIAIQRLEGRQFEGRLVNLKGGLEAWKKMLKENQPST
jgi:adenylyltransferase/sulfurtransferase